MIEWKNDTLSHNTKPANAYGSVHHLLIDFSLHHYHAPKDLWLMVQALYRNPSAICICNTMASSAIWDYLHE